MLEIIALIFLTKKNSTNAKARGKSGGAAIAYTLGLWFGGEILGAVVGITQSGGELTPPVYIAALLFAVGGGVASYFIAKSGKIVAQNQPYPSYQPGAPIGTPYPGQQPGAPTSTPYPGQQPQPPAPLGSQTNMTPCPYCHAPVAPESQLCSHCGAQVAQVQTAQQPAPDQAFAAPPATQAQTGVATINFIAKKVFGQFLVSNVTLEINGVPYQANFNQPITIQAPSGNVQIVCYMNYMGKSGLAQMFVALAPNQSYQVEYQSPAVVTSEGKLSIFQMS